LHRKGGLKSNLKSQFNHARNKNELNFEVFSPSQENKTIVTIASPPMQAKVADISYKETLIRDASTQQVSSIDKDESYRNNKKSSLKNFKQPENLALPMHNTSDSIVDKAASQVISSVPSISVKDKDK